jgi:predicted flap endonuclease-1-like 5' DNA nuclease
MPSSVRCFSNPSIPNECDANPSGVIEDAAQGDRPEAEGKGSAEEADNNVASTSSGSTPKGSADRRRSLLCRSNSNNSHGSQQGRIPDLLTVPGIGPRNLEKLMAKGIGKISELKQLYMDKVSPIMYP